MRPRGSIPTRATRSSDEAPEPIRVASVLVLLRRRYVVIVTATLGVAAAALALTLRAETDL